MVRQAQGATGTRSLPRRVLRLLKWLLLTTLLGLALVLLWLHTGSGRDYARGKIVDGANKALPGTLAIGGLEGSLLGEPTLSKISVTSPDGNEVLRIGSLDLGIGLLDLLSGRIAINTLIIDTLDLNIRQNQEGEIDLLQSLLDPNAPPSDAPWPLQISGLTITSGSINFTGKEGRSTHIRSFSLEGLDVESSAKRTKLAIRGLRVELPACKNLKLQLSGDILITEKGFSSSRLRVDLGEGYVELREFGVASDLREVAALVEAQLGTDLLRCLSPETRWVGPIALTAKANKKESDENISFGLSLGKSVVEIKAGKIALEVSKGELDESLGQGGATLTFKKFDPNRFVDIGTPVQATGNFRLSGNWGNPESLEAKIVGAGSAHAAGYAVDLTELSLENTGKEAILNVGLGGYGGSLETSVKVDWSQDPIVLSEGKLSTSVPKLSALPLALPLAGSLSIAETKFSGPITKLKIKGALDGKGLSHQETSLRTLGIEFDFDDLPSSLAGKIELRAQGLRQGRESIGPLEGTIESDKAGKVFALSLSGGRPGKLWAHVGATLTQGLQKSVVVLDKLALRHQELRASLQRKKAPATITLWKDGEVSIKDLKLAIAGGSVSVDGSLKHEIRAKLRRLKLTPLLVLQPDFPLPITATIDGEIIARQSTQGMVTEVDLNTGDLQLSSESEALGVRVSGKMGPDTLAAKVELKSDAKGSMEVQVSARPPRRSWSRVTASILRSASLGFDNFDFTLLRPLHPELASIQGQLDGKLSIGAGANKIAGTLALTRVRHDYWKSEGALELDIQATRSNATIDILAKDSLIGNASLSLALRPPGPLHSPWRWPLTVKGVFRDSELVLEEIDLVALRAALPDQKEIADIDSGTLDARFKFREDGRLLVVDLLASKVSVEGLPAINASLESTLGKKMSEVSWKLWVDNRNQVEGELSLGAGHSLLRPGVDREQLLARLRKAKLDARVSGKSSSPTLWARFIGSDKPLPLSGSVTASGSFTGSLEKPGGSAQIDIAKAKIDGVALRRVSLAATLEGGVAEAVLSVSQSLKRRVKVAAEFDISKRNLLAGTLDAKDIDLRILRALDKNGEGVLSSIAGEANGHFEVSGALDALKPSGSLRIRRGAIDLGGSLLPIVGISMKIDAKDKTLTLEGKAKSGSGRLKISGQAKVNRDGFRDIGLQLRTTKIPIVVASLVCSVDLDTHSQIVIKPGLVDIKTKIDSALVRVPIRSFLAKTRSLHSLEGMSDLVYISPESEQDDTEIDQSGTLVRLRIVAKENVMVRTNELLARLNLDLDTTFVDNKVVINGNAAVSSGHIDLFERRYIIEKARANFRGRVPTNPSFDLRLRHDFDQLALTILGRGAVDDPKITFLADPADYDQSTLLAIVLGQAPAQNENQEGLRDNALSALSTYAANKVQDILAPILPFDLDVVRVENTDNDGYLYVGGKWINDDWFVAYHYRTLAEELENTHEAESKYLLSKAWSLEGVAGESEAGLDVLWTKRWGK